MYTVIETINDRRGSDAVVKVWGPFDTEKEAAHLAYHMHRSFIEGYGEDNKFDFTVIKTERP